MSSTPQQGTTTSSENAPLPRNDGQWIKFGPACPSGFTAIYKRDEPMRILDEDGDKAIDRATLYLTKAEAVELKNALEALLTEPNKHHEHISDADYNRELTVCIYDLSVIDQFDDRSKRIIAQGI